MDESLGISKALLEEVTAELEATKQALQLERAARLKLQVTNSHE